jgi:hypothetical protein
MYVLCNVSGKASFYIDMHEKFIRVRYDLTPNSFQIFQILFFIALGYSHDWKVQKLVA